MKHVAMNPYLPLYEYIQGIIWCGALRFRTLETGDATGWDTHEAAAQNL